MLVGRSAVSAAEPAWADGADGPGGNVAAMSDHHSPTPTDDGPTSTAPGPADPTSGPVPTSDTRAPGPDPAFGPSGYLPARASARARKIVLRAPLGLQWVVGALVAGVAVLVAGVLFLTSSGPPQAPFVATVAISDVDGAAPLDDLDALLVTGGGPAVVFAGRAAHELAWCATSRRIEGVDGTAAANWHAATGRGFGVESLATHPVVVHDGIAYVDPTRTSPGPRPSDLAEPTRCR